MAKFAQKFVEGMTSTAGLKMPLSGMVEKTTIIQSGNSQTSASGTSAACSATERQSRTADFDLMRAPSRARGSRARSTTASAAIV